MRNLFGKKLFSLMIVCSLLALSITAMAQGRYRGRRYTKADVDRIIKRVETHSDTFTKAVDRSLDNGRLDGTEAEDRINEQVKDLEKALDELRGEFDKRDAWIEVRENVVKVIDEAQDVNAIFHRRHLKPLIEGEWFALRAEINKLAGIYNVRLLK
ncbi:MAG TPA: hypothetical protein VID27_02800 [Blastocatellia bacterium]